MMKYDLAREDTDRELSMRGLFADHIGVRFLELFLRCLLTYGRLRFLHSYFLGLLVEKKELDSMQPLENSRLLFSRTGQVSVRENNNLESLSL